MHRLIMFDLDGTLVRTSSEDALYIEAMKTWLNIDTVNSDWTSFFCDTEDVIQLMLQEARPGNH